MEDFVQNIAYATMGACAAIILVAVSVGLGGDAKMFAAVATGPVQWLGWAAITGAAGGIAFRISR